MTAISRRPFTPDATLTPPTAVRIGTPTHDQFQEQIEEVADWYGWHHMHVRRARGKADRYTTPTSRVGWPDLFLWHHTLGAAAIEVKVGKDKPTFEQRQVLEELAAAGMQTLVAYPSDWPAVLHLLSGVRAAS